MRILIYFVIVSFIYTSSCAGLNKNLRKNKKPVASTTITKTEETKTIDQPIPIKEVEEMLVPKDGKIPDASRYFVIIGSFRNPENAKKYQGQLLDDGFSSEILKNEEGLYRVSVLATNDINNARDDIRHIRKVYPKYFDTWLLLQKK